MILKYFAIHIEQPNKDCLYNAYKYGDICRGMCYFIQSSTEPLFVKKKKKYIYVQRHFFFNSFFLFWDCPTGYFGENCTDKCKHPKFGIFCSETCDCPVCHHILGCISTTENMGKLLSIIFHFPVSRYRGHKFCYKCLNKAYDIYPLFTLIMI